MEHLGKQGIVLMDFWASWCGPCKMMIPIIDQIAAEYQDRLTIIQINVDEHPDIASRYAVMSIPTLIILQDGRPVDRITGTASKEAIRKKIEQILAG